MHGAIDGLTLATSAPAVFKALVEATAFGSRAINERMLEEGVPIDNIIAIGGIARKSSFVMRTMADVMGMPIRVLDSDQACALGAAMFAAVAAGHSWVGCRSAAGYAPRFFGRISSRYGTACNL